MNFFQNYNLIPNDFMLLSKEFWYNTVEYLIYLFEIPNDITLHFIIHSIKSIGFILCISSTNSLIAKVLFGQKK